MAVRTIQAPGIQVNEIDRSEYNKIQDNSLTDSPNCFIVGFADKGDDYAIHKIISREALVEKYGYPQTEAERYFYNGCLEILNNGGKLLTSKLPYDNNVKDKYAYVDYKIDPNLYRIIDNDLLSGKWHTINDVRETLKSILRQKVILSALGTEASQDISTLPKMREIVLSILNDPNFQEIQAEYEDIDLNKQRIVVTNFIDGVYGVLSTNTDKYKSALNEYNKLFSKLELTSISYDSENNNYLTYYSVQEFIYNLEYDYKDSKSYENLYNYIYTDWINDSSRKQQANTFFEYLDKCNSKLTIQTVVDLRDAIKEIVNALNSQYPYIDLMLNDNEITSYCNIIPDIDQNTGMAKSGLLTLDKLDDYLTNDYTDIHNKIRIVDITRQQYEQASFDSIKCTLSDDANSQYSIYTNDCLGIVPVIVSPANALYIQGMLQEADCADYNCIKSFNTVIPQNSNITSFITQDLINDNVYIALQNNEGDPCTKETLSKMAADCFPQIEYAVSSHFDKEHFKKIGVVVLSAYIDNANNKKLNFSVLESFVGSLDKTAKSISDNSSIFIDNIVNNNSQYIRLFSSANTKTIKEASIITIKDQTATSLGFYKADCSKIINAQQSILSPLKKQILCNMEDTRGYQIDLIIDAGLTNIAQYLSDNENNLDKTYPSNSSMNSRPGRWFSVATIFDDFCKFTRRDCMYLLDCPRPFCLEGDQKIIRRTKPTNTILNNIVPKLKYITGLNSSYTAGYCNWFKCKDAYTSNIFWCPPSIKAAQVYIYTDVYYHTWDAPAGMNRGKLSDVLDTAFSPTNSEAGRLYTQCWNYAVNYPSDGIVIEGQRTFQRKATALDRVNVRRLMLYLEKQTVNVAKYFLYEGHTSYLRDRFVNTLTPIFEKAVNGYGISDYIIKCDDENNTSTTIDRNELHCTIAVKPVKAVEFIVLNFIVTNQSATVSEEVQNI